MALRARYDDVIKMYQDKEEKIRESIVMEISKIDAQITQLERKVDELTNKLQTLSESVQEMKLREIARSQINGSNVAPPP